MALSVCMLEEEKQKRILFNWRLIVDIITKISKSNKILLLVLLVLLLIGGYYYWPKTPPKTIDLKNISSQIDHINIQRGELKYQLVKSNDRWLLASEANTPANQEAIGQLLNALAGLNLDQPFSQNPAKQAGFQVDDKGWRLDLLTGEQKNIGLIVGKYGPAWPSSFVRLENSDNVYLVNVPLTQILEQSEWQDLVIAQISDSKIQKIEWVGKMAIEKKDNSWIATQPKSVNIDENKLQPVLSALANFSALSIASEQKSEIEKKVAVLTIKVSTADQQIVISFWSQNNDQYYAIRQGDERVFLISKGLFANINQKLEQLKK